MLLDRLHAPRQIAKQPVDALEGRLCAAPPLFQAGQLRRHLRRFLLQRLALLPQDFQLRLPRVQAAVRLAVLRLKARRLFALLRNGLALGLARVLVARRLRLPLLQAPLDALRLGFHLLQRRAQRGCLAFAQPPLLAARLQLRRQLLDGAAQRIGFPLRLLQIRFQLRQPALGLAQLALQRQRAFAGRLAARHRGAMEALAVRREEIRMHVAQRQPLRVDGILRQIAVPQLGQHRFQRAPKAVQHFHGIAQRRYAGLPNRIVAGLEELALRIGVNQECRPAVAGLQHAHAFFRRAPAFHHHVIQLFAQKLVHHAFVLAAHFNEVRQRAHRSHRRPQRSRLQQPPHRVGGVAVIANQRLQRVAPAQHGRLFAAQLVGLCAARAFVAALGLQRLAQRRNLLLQPLHRRICRCKAQPRLARLHAQVFLLNARLAHLRFQPLRFAFQRGQAFFALRNVVARVA